MMLKLNFRIFIQQLHKRIQNFKSWMLNWLWKIRKLIHLLRKSIRFVEKIDKKWETWKPRILLNKIPSVILSQAINETLKNSDEEYMSWKVKWVIERLKLTWGSTLWDKISKAKSKPMPCSSLETNSCMNGRINLREISNTRESPMSTFCKTPTFPDDRLCRWENKWELSLRPLRIRKWSRSETFSSCRRTDLRQIWWTKSINWETRRRRMQDC